MDVAMKAMMAEIAPVIRDFVTDAQAPLIERIASLEGEKGVLAARCEALEAVACETATAIVADFRVESAEELKNLLGADGEQRDADIRGYFECEIAPVKAENEELRARLKALEDRPAPEVIKGDPGESIDPAVVSEMVVAEVAKAAAAIRVPQDGKDAAGIVEALKDNGELVLTLQDGRLIRTGVRDGEKGKDGRDGFNLEDFDACVLDDDRTIQFSFKSESHEHIATLKWPTVIYREVYNASEKYDAGDAVTWGGSLWIAQRATDAKPDTPDSGWRLAAKKGRDGKDAKHG